MAEERVYVNVTVITPPVEDGEDFRFWNVKTIEGGAGQTPETLIETHAQTLVVSTILVNGVAHGKLNWVESALEEDVSLVVEARDQDARTLLHLAAGRSNAAIVAALVEAGADVDAEDSSQATPLFHAARRGDASVLITLLDAGADPDVTGTDGRAFQLLIYTDGAPLWKDTDEWTPLHYAAQRASVEMTSVLLDFDADVDAADTDGWTPLHVAASTGDLAVVQMLLDAGANIEARTSDEITLGTTPLLAAAHNGRSAAVQALLTAGADVATVNSHGCTVLHRVPWCGCDATTIEALVLWGAGTGAKDEDGDTPRDVAYQLGQEVLFDAAVVRARGVRWTRDVHARLPPRARSAVLTQMLCARRVNAAADDGRPTRTGRHRLKLPALPAEMWLEILCSVFAVDLIWTPARVKGNDGARRSVARDSKCVVS